MILQWYVVSFVEFQIFKGGSTSERYTGNNRWHIKWSTTVLVFLLHWQKKCEQGTIDGTLSGQQQSWSSCYIGKKNVNSERLYMTEHRHTYLAALICHITLRDSPNHLSHVLSPIIREILIYNLPMLRYFKISFYVNSHADKLFRKWKRIGYSSHEYHCAEGWWAWDSCEIERW
jgi:hypothetical protein